MFAPLPYWILTASVQSGSSLPCKLANIDNPSPTLYLAAMAFRALILLLLLSGCIGYARGDGDGNVEVVTNLGSVGEIPDDETDEDDPAR